MMNEENPIPRSRWLHLRIRPEEHEKLMRKFRGSTCRKLSEFVRNCLFEKPITMLRRNASLDQGLLELGMLREELRAIGQNLNQIAYKVNRDPAAVSDRLWQADFTLQRRLLESKYSELLRGIDKVAGLWLQ